MSVNYFDEWGHPITLRDVVDPDEIEGYEAADLPEPYLDTEDEWSRDAIIAMLIVAFQDADAPVVAPW